MKSLTEKKQKKHYNQFFDKEFIRNHQNRGSSILKEDLVNNYYKKYRKNYKDVCEIGCGIGSLSHQLKPHYKTFLGIDISDKALNLTRKLHGSKKIKFINTNLCTTKTSMNNKFDTVILNGSLHHMPLTKNFFYNINKISKKNAIFIFVEPHNKNFLINLLRNIRKKIDKTYTEDQVFFDPEIFKKTLNKNGLKVLKEKYYGFLVPPFAEVPLKPQFFGFLVAKILIFMELILNFIMVGKLRKLTWLFGIYCKK